MALFEINRYKEDDDEILDEDTREKSILFSLKEKIEKRKKAKLRVTKPKLSMKSVDLILQDVTSETLSNLPNDTIENEIESTDKGDEIITDAKEVISQFQILGVKDFEKKAKVKRVLPYWLSHPTAVSINLKDDNTAVDEIKYLHDSLKKKMIRENNKFLFPVQAQVIPWLLQEYNKGEYFWPRDVCVSAPTGSGKTLAYVLPIVQILANRIDRQIRALVVLPVKELAVQVAKVFKDFCIGTNLKVALVTGAYSFPQEQLQLLKYTKTGGWQSEVDILVCTAGRLVEHLQFSEGFSLRHLKFLVIDEADRIMQHIQNDWLHHLNQHIEFGKTLLSGNAPPLNFKTISSSKKPPQKLFFSATLSQDPEKLKEWGLFQPKLFSVVTQPTNNNNNNNNDMEISYKTIGKYTTPLELTEKYVVCNIEQKPAILHTLLKKSAKRVLCFTNSAQSAHRLSILLKHMLNGEMTVVDISSTLGRNARDVVLKKFQNGDVNVLISTDALARGIDIVNCDNVISYDPPKNIKTYIHRVGRTGRAGREGTAIAILLQNQLKPFQAVLKIAEKSNIEELIIENTELDEVQNNYSDALIKFKSQMSEESTKQVTKLKAAKRGRSRFNHKKNIKLKQNK